MANSIKRFIYARWNNLHSAHHFSDPLKLFEEIEKNRLEYNKGYEDSANRALKHGNAWAKKHFAKMCSREAYLKKHYTKIYEYTENDFQNPIPITKDNLLSFAKEVKYI